MAFGVWASDTFRQMPGVGPFSPALQSGPEAFASVGNHG
jgi:hypothetical protein